MSVDAGRAVSVIIPTKDRPADLRRTIESLRAQSIRPAEVIIVDQSADESSSQTVLDAQGKDDSLRILYTRDLRILSGAEARNRAMDRASGDIWLFLDDDVELEPDFIEQILVVYAQQPSVSGVSGVVTNYSRPAGASVLWQRAFLRGPFRDDRQAVYWKWEEVRDAEPVKVTRLGGGLMSFRASAIRNVRFDETLRGVSDGEDVDFCMRLHPRAELVITGRARLVHHQSPVLRLRDHWLRRHARAMHYLYARHWRTGVVNRMRFVWLHVGYCCAAALSTVRRGSVESWRALLRGIIDARQTIARGRASAGSA